MKSAKMIVLFSCFIIMAACDFTDPYTLNVDLRLSESGPTASPPQSGHKNKKVDRVYDFTLFDIDARPVSLSKFRGKVLLLVNTASRCGYTPQYEQLQQLYERYQPRGFEILAFPSKDFGGPRQHSLEHTRLETTHPPGRICSPRGRPPARPLLLGARPFTGKSSGDRGYPG